MSRIPLCLGGIRSASISGRVPGWVGIREVGRWEAGSQEQYHQDTCVAVADGPLLPVCPRNSGAPVAHGLLYNTSFTRLSPTLVIGLLRALYLFLFCSAPRTWHLHDTVIRLQS